VGDTVELPALRLSKQVKSIHMFHKPVPCVSRGDRAGLCVTQLNAKLIERGLAAAPGSVPTFAAAVAAVDRVRFYGGAIPSKSKYHVIIGHATVMAAAMFFGLPDGQGVSQGTHLKQVIGFLSATAQHAPLPPFDWSKQYVHQTELYGLEGRAVQPTGSGSTAAASGGNGSCSSQVHYGQQWALLTFDQPLTAPQVCAVFVLCECVWVWVPAHTAVCCAWS
jgi:selenocysteine-specific elongation factor